MVPFSLTDNFTLPIITSNGLLVSVFNRIALELSDQSEPVLAGKMGSNLDYVHLPRMIKIMIEFATLSDRLKYYLIICGGSLLLTIDLNSRILAQSNLAPSSPAVCDLDLGLLKSIDINNDRNIVTADTVSAQGTTIPSLWWTSEQAPPKLVTNWIANRSQNQIYLLVNSQYWNILDYVDRYRTIDKFGRVAQGYGYNLKICNSQKIALADYTCDSTGNPSLTPNNCQIWLNATGQNGLGVLTK